MKRSVKMIMLGMVFSGLVVIGSAARSFSGDKLHISGYGNAHTMDHSGMPRLLEVEDKTTKNDNPNDLFFQLREFSLFFDFEVSEGILASVEMEAGDNASVFTPNYAYVEIDFPSISAGWNTDFWGGLSLRLGKVLVPFLSYNENKPNFKQNLMSQPFTAWNLAPVIPSAPGFVGLGWSDTGGVLNWTREVGRLALVDVKLAVVNGLHSDSEVLDANTIRLDGGMMTPVVRPRDGLMQNDHNHTRDNNRNKATVAKLTLLSSDIPLDIGFSWYQGAWDQSGEKDLSMQGVHLNWLEPDWTLKGEWVTAHVEQGAGVDPVGDMMAAMLNTSTGDYDMNAWYAEGSYIPLRYGARADRFLRLVIRYDDVDTNDKAIFTPFDRSRITLGSEWQFASNIRLRYEWQKHSLDDFDKAPDAFKSAGGEARVKMHMVSIIFWF